MFLKNKKFKLVALICLTSIMCIFGVVGFTSNANDKDVNSIQKVVVKAIELDQTLPIMQGDFSKNDNKMTDNAKSEHKKYIVDELTKVYSSSSQILAQRISQMGGTIDVQEKQHFRAEDGGVKSPEFLSVTVNGDNAVAELNATTWSKFTEYVDGKSKSFTPENRAKYTCTLVNEDGAWKVTGVTLDFLPGQEP